jgi:hypothetical protein
MMAGGAAAVRLARRLVCSLLPRLLLLPVFVGGHVGSTTFSAPAAPSLTTTALRRRLEEPPLDVRRAVCAALPGSSSCASPSRCPSICCVCWCSFFCFPSGPASACTSSGGADEAAAGDGRGTGVTSAEEDGVTLRSGDSHARRVAAMVTCWLAGSGGLRRRGGKKETRR